MSFKLEALNPQTCKQFGMSALDRTSLFGMRRHVDAQRVVGLASVELLNGCWSAQPDSKQFDFHMDALCFGMDVQHPVAQHNLISFPVYDLSDS